VKRREFITLLGAAATAWPMVTSAQERVRRIGVLMPEPENYPEPQARMMAFQEALAKLGWMVGRNLVIDSRWEISNPERGRAAAADLLALSPDVILATATSGALGAKAATSSVPIVFVAVSEPVAQGIVASLARPGGNATGFSYFEPSFGPKWLELLKEIAPHVTRVATIFNPDTAPFAIPMARAVEAVAPNLAMQVETDHVRGPVEIEAAIVRLASAPQGGFILLPVSSTAGHRKLIIDLAARHRLPAVYGLKFFAIEDGLAFYGPDVVDLFRKAAGYVDRILKGQKPADLAVQQPTQF